MPHLVGPRYHQCLISVMWYEKRKTITYLYAKNIIIELLLSRNMATVATWLDDLRQEIEESIIQVWLTLCHLWKLWHFLSDIKRRYSLCVTLNLSVWNRRNHQTKRKILTLSVERNQGLSPAHNPVTVRYDQFY